MYVQYYTFFLCWSPCILGTLQQNTGDPHIFHGEKEILRSCLLLRLLASSHILSPHFFNYFSRIYTNCPHVVPVYSFIDILTVFSCLLPCLKSQKFLHIEKISQKISLLFFKYMILISLICMYLILKFWRIRDKIAFYWNVQVWIQIRDQRYLGSGSWSDKSSSDKESNIDNYILAILKVLLCKYRFFIKHPVFIFLVHPVEHISPAGPLSSLSKPNILFVHNLPHFLSR